MEITATYRLQLHAGFGFREATEIVDYLHDLGISHVYASPYLKAEPQSTHGYNLVDPTSLNPEIGDHHAFAQWTDALASRSMGHLVDVVPNHMAATPLNAWWHDVLENGPSSLFANHFDIEWHSPRLALENKVLLPILGAQYGEVLERGELRLGLAGGAFHVRYGERCLPLDPTSVVTLVERASAALAFDADDPRRQELESIATGLKHLPASTASDAAMRSERAREKEVLKRRLAVLGEDPEVRSALYSVLAKLNGRPGDPRSFDELDRLLVEQRYRLAYWRVATEEINYRRFFDVNELAAVRMEDPAVFADMHGLLLELVAQKRVQGLRLDHTDGLYDPAAYFAKLRSATGPSPVYIVAEKILSAGERLPEGWPIDGTTGYDFLAQASGLFVDRRAEPLLTSLYRELTGDRRSFAEHALAAKRAVMRASLASEVTMLAQRLERIATRDRRSRDFTLPVLRRVISETIAAFPVYRTYLRPDGSREPSDERIVAQAIRAAKRQNAEVSPSAFDFLRDVLLPPPPGSDAEIVSLEDRREKMEFAMRFQQLTGPVTAKGVEDTVFYTYVRFVATNEVGGDAERMGTSPHELHSANAERRERWPRTMIATSTHDTKRGEDVRARLAVLSEMPEEWAARVRDWEAHAQRHTRIVEDEMAPSAADRYLFFQTVLGAWPMDVPSSPSAAFLDRLVAYAIKAAREAKQRTSWLSGHEGYEQALEAFVRGVLGDREMLARITEAVRRTVTAGASNGLALSLLKATCPGVSDTYQGSETWDLRLVDPDNRAPVDYVRLRTLAARARTTPARELLATFADGAIKLHVLRAALRQRREMEDLFLAGTYEPIDAGDEIFAFRRRHGGRAMACAAVRQPHRITAGRSPWALGDAWGNRSIPVGDGSWRDVLTETQHTVRDGRLPAARLFAELPVALLVR